MPGRWEEWLAGHDGDPFGVNVPYQEDDDEENHLRCWACGEPCSRLYDDCERFAVCDSRKCREKIEASKEWAAECAAGA